MSCTSKLTVSPCCPLHRLTCCCWKDLSLFLKREGRTKSHPLARKASSPLRSGSLRNDVSLIIMVGAKMHTPPPGTASAATDKATAQVVQLPNKETAWTVVKKFTSLLRYPVTKQMAKQPQKSMCVISGKKRPFNHSHSQNFSPPGSTHLERLPKQ